MPDKVWKRVQNLKRQAWDVRYKAVWALGEIKHESAVEPLIQALKDKNKDVRESATWALDRIVESLEEKRVEGKKLTPEGEKLLKVLALVKPHFTKDQEGRITESWEVQARALEAAYNNEIDEKNARLYVKQLRAMKGNLK